MPDIFDELAPDAPAISPAKGDIFDQLATDTAPSKGSGIYANMHPDFGSKLKSLVDASGGRLSITDGFRSAAQQEDLYRRKPTLAAKPGHSLHEKGLAADLSGDLDWAHANAGRFGLVFPMLDPKGKKYEPWHVQPDNYTSLSKGGKDIFDQITAEAKTPPALDPAAIAGTVAGIGGRLVSDTYKEEQAAKPIGPLSPINYAREMARRSNPGMDEVSINNAAHVLLKSRRDRKAVTDELGIPPQRTKIGIAQEVENTRKVYRDPRYPVGAAHGQMPRIMDQYGNTVQQNPSDAIVESLLGPHGPQGLRDLTGENDPSLLWGASPAATKFLLSFADPEQRLMLVGAGLAGATSKIAGKTISAIFAADMGKNAINDIREGNYGSAAVNGTMGLLSGLHAKGLGGEITDIGASKLLGRDFSKIGEVPIPRPNTLDIGTATRDRLPVGAPAEVKPAPIKPRMYQTAVTDQTVNPDVGIPKDVPTSGSADKLSGVRKLMRSDIPIPVNDARDGKLAMSGDYKTIDQYSLAETIPDKNASVYHETNAPKAKQIIQRMESKIDPYAKLFVSDNQDLALGQGSKGVLLEMDPGLVNGTIHQKPGTDFTSAMGGGSEYIVDKTLPGAIKSITVKNKAQIKSLSEDPSLSKLFDFENGVPAERGMKFNRLNTGRYESYKNYSDPVAEPIRETTAPTPATPKPIKAIEKPKSGTLQSAIIPGAKEFAEQDIAPTVETVKQVASDLNTAFNPASISDAAKDTALTVREHNAEKARKFEIAQESLKKARRLFDKMTRQAKLDFMHAVETGARQADATLQPIADSLRKVLDERAAEVAKYGGMKSFIDNYFPHIWKERETGLSKAVGKLTGRRPLDGAKTFQKQRYHATIKEGMATGLEPVSDNPVDLTLLKLHEMDRYVMAQKIWREMKGKGNLAFVSVTGKTGLHNVLDAAGNITHPNVNAVAARGAQKLGFKTSKVKGIPEGWAKINDKMAEVFAPMDAEGTLRKRGEYYAPEPVARILNNFLSPGLRGSSAYNAAAGVSNALNMAQLGMSAFHLMFTSVDAMTSKLSLAIEQASRGDIKKAAGSTLGTAIAPVSNFIRGDRMLKEYMKPGSQGGDIPLLVQSLIEGGGRAKMDSVYSLKSDAGATAADRFFKAFKTGNYPGAALRLFPAAVESLSHPIMGAIVPRMKLGIFMDMARMELERLGPSATPEQRRAAMSSAWDSVDNRMGQMVYDNLFWNRTLKDTLSISTRSLGWNIGTWRELGGAGVDVAKTMQRFKDGDPLVTHRMAYVMALPLTVGALGAMMQYLMTGKGPQDLKDYFYPRTGGTRADGKPERVQIASYMKDVAPLELARERGGIGGMLSKAGEMASHKSSPLISMVMEMVANKDFYGAEIRNKDAPAVEQLEQWGKYVLKQGIPFAARNVQDRQKAGDSTAKQLQSFVGITPAQADIDQSPAEILMHRLIQEKMPQGAKTEADVERSDFLRSLRDRARKGEEIGKDVSQAIQSGKMSIPQAKTLLGSKEQNLLKKGFKHLELPEASKVWAIATDDERKELLPLYGPKLTSYAKANPGDQKTVQDAAENLRSFKYRK